MAGNGAIAAIAGETRWVRPLNPWRPSKLRFEVEAQRLPGASRSGFIARQHGAAGLTLLKSRSKEDRVQVGFGVLFDKPRARATMAFTLGATCFPSTILAAARKSSIRPFVQEPIKTRSILMSVIFSPPLTPP